MKCNPTIVLAQCTASKFDCTDEAQRVYSKSSYFRKQRKYARLKADQWYIQSAEYGLLKPDEEISAYDTHADNLDDPETWAWEIANQLRLKVVSPASIEILGGQSYAEPLTPLLERLGYDVIEPLRGLGIGERQAQLDYLCQELSNETLGVEQ